MYQSMTMERREPSNPPSQSSSLSASSNNLDAEQRPRRLRQSCDACSVAKVRCGKEHPICRRCATIRVKCNYSPSLRMGKPRNTRHLTLENPQTRSFPAVQASQPPHTGPTFIHSHVGPTMVTSGEFPVRRLDAPLLHPLDNMADFDSSGHSSPRLDPTPGPFYEEFGFPSAGLPFDHQTLNFEGRLNLTEYTTNTSQYPIDPTLHQTIAELSHPELSMVNPMSTLPYLAPPSRSPSITSYDGRHMSARPEQMANIQAKRHDCNELALSTLSSLYPCREGPDEPSVTISLDKALAANQTAIGKISQLLHCACSQDPHFPVTVAFIILRCLSWYEAVFKRWKTSFANMSKGSERDGSTHPVLNDLSKVEELIEKFSRRFCEERPGNDSIHINVYQTLRALLRTRVQQTFRAAN